MSEEKKEFKQLRFGQIDGELLFMKGKLLTIIDALGLSEQQSKATKDLIHSAVGSTRNVFWRYAIGEDIFPGEGQQTNS